MSTAILGISAYYHDSAAALVVDGEIVAAAQEERFSRIKHDPSFPAQAVTYCLGEAGITIEEIDFVVYYEKPLLKFERILETYLKHAPKGFSSFVKSMPTWLKEKLFLKRELRNELAKIGECTPANVPDLLFTAHHQSHAASAFFPSHFEKSAILCLDGVGEWATTSCWKGDRSELTPIWEIKFPHSLGLLYSAFTYYCGFRVNSGEYKLMGLAPYGSPKYVSKIYDNLLNVRENGDFQLNTKYFNYEVGLSMTGKKFDKLFGRPPRDPESELTEFDMDLARSIQQVTEETVVKIAQNIKSETKERHLCLAGGVALNCVANAAIRKAAIFEDIYVQPASGDAGGAIGAALAGWHIHLDKPRTPAANRKTSQSGTYLGPSYTDNQIKQELDELGAAYEHLADSALQTVAELLDKGNVVGWFQGRMEFGPRALGARSILADPRDPDMQSKVNLKIKFRESFRPFAPAVLAERASEWFDLNTDDPFMLFTSKLSENKRIAVDESQHLGLDKLKVTRSEVPSVTHVDYSARVQTVHKESNPRFWELIQKFYQITGCPILINTSFNVRGEPIVSSPTDALKCLARTEMDYLLIGNLLIKRSEQSNKLIDKLSRYAITPD
ncbi:carbamoyltransferase [Pelagicoccus enzymogenes]|uniref:carbamoyltransferase family protein n=1 Tax=Pelagicoccus enzymogenes TaxID=2773457 RepID=UPI00280C45D4|nr:carbamoyltransferase [Pelagicoccus enzymogenes]MDQ8197550.1 carbamoyltransferase [Pelagicoccus enzymogenes]